MSGQYLSPSGGGHALTPPKHLRLGEPLPHQLANTTQAAPPAESHLWPLGVIGYYPQFPVAIPGRGVRDLRVPTPFAAFPLAGYTLDLHA